MQFDVEKELKDFNGNPLKDGTVDVDGKPKSLTLRTVCTEALVVPEEVSGTEHLRRFQLAQQVHGAEKTMDMSAEQMSLLKKLITRRYTTPLIVGQALDMLDPPAEKEQE